ncbi:MAG: hypothetical protein HRT35_00875 [Algicola sp.]|nr:hypothetical protein [Algicola sp.]
MTFNQSEVDDIVESGEQDAESLLLKHCPKHAAMYVRATKKLQEAIKGIKEVFPDASYYSANDGICIILGETHQGQGQDPQRQRAVNLAGVPMLPELSGGDW